MPLSGWQGIEVVATEVGRDHLVEIVLVLGRRELLQHRDALGIADELAGVPSERALHQRLDALADILEGVIVERAAVALLERGALAEEVLVDQARQAPQLNEVVL